MSDYEGPAYGRILEEAWTRYGLPIALTEVHAGCTREDQLRWFVSAWQAASAARQPGRRRAGGDNVVTPGVLRLEQPRRTG